MYTIYASASNNTPFCTHVSSYVVWKSTPPLSGGGKNFHWMVLSTWDLVFSWKPTLHVVLANILSEGSFLTSLDSLCIALHGIVSNVCNTILIVCPQNLIRFDTFANAEKVMISHIKSYQCQFWWFAHGNVVMSFFATTKTSSWFVATLHIWTLVAILGIIMLFANWRICFEWPLPFAKFRTSFLALIMLP